MIPIYWLLYTVIFNWYVILLVVAEIPAKIHKIPLILHKEEQYLGVLEVGTPAQNFTVLFDTTSSNLWNPSSECHRYELLCGNGSIFCRHKHFLPNMSGSYERDGRDVTYVYEWIIEGWRGHNPHVVSNESTEIPTLLDTMVEQKVIEQPIFAFYLNGNNSELAIGGIDKKRFTPPIHYLPVINGTNWMVKMGKVSYGSTVTLCSAGCNLTFDTRTRFLIGPYTDVLSIHHAMNASPWGNGQYSVPCEGVGSLSDIVLTLNGVRFTFQPRDYTIKKTIGNETLCFTGLCAADLMDNVWYSGSELMTKYYTIKCCIVHFQRVFYGISSPLRDQEAFKPLSIAETRRQI